MTNVTSVFYLRGKGAEGQVTELLKCLILSCRAARVKTSYTCYCLLHNSIAYFWLWHYHDRWEEEAGLTGVHLELIHHPVNHKPFVPQNVWLQFLPKLTDRRHGSSSSSDWSGRGVFLSHAGTSGWAVHTCANPKECSGKQSKPHHDVCINILKFFWITGDFSFNLKTVTRIQLQVSVTFFTLNVWWWFSVGYIELSCF